jgi:hypothetical protein
MGGMATGRGWAPELRVHETGSGCRLTLAGLSYGNGATLQEAADDLVTRLLSLVLCVRTSGLRIPPGAAGPDPRALAYLWELGEIARRGDDIRPHLFGASDHDDAVNP